MFVTSYLGTNTVVGYRAEYNVVIMQSSTVRVCTVVIDEVCPFLGVILKPLGLELFKERFIKVS